MKVFLNTDQTIPYMILKKINYMQKKEFVRIPDERENLKGTCEIQGNVKNW